MHQTLNRRAIPVALSMALATAGFALALTGPGYAQTTVETLTVTAHGPKAHSQARSYGIGFRDIDIRSEDGFAELRRRITVTAKYVCNQLDITDKDQRKACQDRAVSDGMATARKLRINALAQHEAWKPGPAWKPPPGVK